MRYILAIAMTGLALSWATALAQDMPKPILSSDPLTAEQIAVYRAVLGDYTKGTNDGMNLADKAETLERSGPSGDECFKEIKLEPAQNTVPVIHLLTPSVALNPKFVLVDPEKQAERIKENDPQKLMKKAIDDHAKVTNKDVDISVKQAFKSGLFTLSEIVFDKEHRRAVVAYSFVCGMLCGNGDTLLLNKIGQEWKVAKKCGGWVS